MIISDKGKNKKTYFQFKIAKAFYLYCIELKLSMEV